MSRIGRGPGALRRWGSALGGTLLLAGVPAAVSRLPADADRVPPADLLARIRASATTGYQGYAESSGRIVLPDVPQVEEVFALLGGTTRLRVWWRGPADWRVDTITAIGEHGLYHDGLGTRAWDSFDRRVTRVYGDPAVRLPRPADLLPPELGRRLAAAVRDGDALAALRPREVAGRSVPGVRVVPGDPATTIGRVDVWADPRTGLPLEVRLTAKGARHPAIESRFLELSLATPRPERTTFVPPRDAEYHTQQAADLLAAIDGFAPLLLPDRAGARARRGGSDGATTYGEGFGQVAAVVVPGRLARRVYRALEAAPARDLDAGTRALTTPLLNGLVVTDAGFGTGLVVSGAVTVETLRTVAAQLSGQLRIRQ